MTAQVDELCLNLGFCLPPREQQRLRESPPLNIEAFTDAVFAAERLNSFYPATLRRQMRESQNGRAG
jgi:hypothetical protein